MQTTKNVLSSYLNFPDKELARKKIGAKKHNRNSG